MVQELFDRYVFLYIMAGFCAFGVIIKLFLLMAYSRMIKASDSMSNTKKRWMKQMKLKFETCYQLKIGVNNVDVFVDKYVSRRKSVGILLSTWERISGQAVSLCLLTGSIAGVLGVISDCGWKETLFTFFAGLWTSLIVIIVDNIVNIKAKKELLHLNLTDYFENYLKVRLEREHFYPEQLTKYNHEYFGDQNPSLQSEYEKEPETSDRKERSRNPIYVEAAHLEEVPLERIPLTNGEKRYDKGRKIDFTASIDQTRNLKDSVYVSGKTAKRLEKQRRKEEKARLEEEARIQKAMDKQKKSEEKITARENAKKSKLDQKEQRRIEKQERLEQIETAKLEKIQTKKREEEEILEQKRMEREKKNESRRSKDSLSDRQVLEKKMRLRQEMELERLKRAEETERYSQMKKSGAQVQRPQEAEEFTEPNDTLVQNQNQNKKVSDLDLVKAIPASKGSQSPEPAADMAASVDHVDQLVLGEAKKEEMAAKPVEKKKEEKTAEDKLIEEVLREFLA